MSWWDLILAGPAVGRSDERELLDAKELDPRELHINLREMAMLNRLPGGIGASLAAVGRATQGRTGARVLDVGTGWGDFPRRLRTAHPGLDVTAIDSRPEVLAIAERNLPTTSNVTLLQADARRLPFADGSFEVAHASLLLHHLDPPEASTVLREMARVAPAVVVNDLRRGRVANAVITLTVLALARGRYTRHDGPLSARRAYAVGELDELAADAGLSVAWRTPRAWPRVTTVYR